MEHSTEASAILEAATDFGDVQVINAPDGSMLALAVPRGRTLESVKSYVDRMRTAPERRKGTARLVDLESFIAWAHRHMSATETVLFADPGSATLTAVIDGHPETDGQVPVAEVPAGWQQHRGVYAFPVSDAWKKWLEAGADWMTQEEFAELLEDRLVDLLDPSSPVAADRSARLEAELNAKLATPSAIASLAEGLKVRVESGVAQTVNLGSGETRFAYSEEHKDESGAPLKVPGAFLLSIPVFDGANSALYVIGARLRYRLRRQNGKASVVWRVQLSRADAVFRDAFGEACERAKTELGLPLFYGTPEI